MVGPGGGTALAGSAAEPLLQAGRGGDREGSSSSGAGPEKKQELGPPPASCLSTLENILDWAPFIAVQVLAGIPVAPAVALGYGTAAAGFVLLYTFVKPRLCAQPGAPGEDGGTAGASCCPPGWPKTMDSGQLILFGVLWLLAYSTEDSALDGKLLVLWFNPVTTFGLAMIMWASILRGRPFILDAVKSKAPPAIYRKLVTREFFLGKIRAMACFWVRVLVGMTLLVSIQPTLVTVFCGGDVDKDASGNMALLGGLLSLGQFVFLAYGLWFSFEMQRQKEAIRKRVREVQKKGLATTEQKLYASFAVAGSGPVSGTSHRIRTISAEQDLVSAASVLTDAFRNDKDLWLYEGGDELRNSWFQAVLRSAAQYNMVMAVYETSEEGTDAPAAKDDEGKECRTQVGSRAPGEAASPVPARATKPRCVVAAIPVMSRSQEEIDVFYTLESWVEHGFRFAADDFPLPSDAQFDHAELRKDPKHGLRARPYLFVALFGADPEHRGCGYGRTFMRHLVALGESSKLLLVVETYTPSSVALYERYGFRVVDNVKGRENYVLMIREAGARPGV